jgi:ditrans,polycis-polyprenyl diphosphate synthase
MAITNYNKMVLLIGVAYASSDVAGKTIMAIANYTKLVLFICVAYTFSDEMVAIQESCEYKWVEIQKAYAYASRTCSGVIRDGEHEMEQTTIKLIDIEKHMYLDVAPILKF